MNRNVLLIDDNSVDRTMYRQMLASGVQGLAFEEAGGAQLGTRLLLRKHYDACFLDYDMPDGNGLEVLRAVEYGCTTPIVMLTGTDDTAVAVQALKTGAVDFVMKDRLNVGDLVSALHDAFLVADRRQEQDSPALHRSVVQAWLHQSEDVVLIIDLASFKLVESSAVGLAQLGFRRRDLVGQDVRTLALLGGEAGLKVIFDSMESGAATVDWRLKGDRGPAVPVVVRANRLFVGGQSYLVIEARRS